MTVSSLYPIANVARSDPVNLLCAAHAKPEDKIALRNYFRRLDFSHPSRHTIPTDFSPLNNMEKLNVNSLYFQLAYHS